MSIMLRYLSLVSLLSATYSLLPGNFLKALVPSTLLLNGIMSDNQFSLIRDLAPRSFLSQLDTSYPSPRTLLGDIFDAIDDDFSSYGLKSSYVKIPIDIKETDKQYEIIADIPGVKKELTKVEFTDGILKISIEKKADTKAETDKYRRIERFSGFASRSIRLPDDANEDKIQASFKEGVLSVKIDKNVEKVQQSKVKNIPIQ